MMITKGQSCVVPATRLKNRVLLPLIEVLGIVGSPRLPITFDPKLCANPRILRCMPRQHAVMVRNRVLISKVDCKCIVHICIEEIVQITWWLIICEALAEGFSPQRDRH